MCGRSREPVQIGTSQRILEKSVLQENETGISFPTQLTVF